MKQISLVFAFAVVSLCVVQSDRARARISQPDYSRIEITKGLTQPKARPCVREDLRIKEGETDAAMGGVRATPFIFTNVSSSACTLEGYPAVELLNQRGAVVRRATMQKSDEPNASATLEPGKTAWFNLNYNSGGAGRVGKPCPAYPKIRIMAHGITRPFVLRSEITSCARTQFEVTFIHPGMPD